MNPWLGILLVLAALGLLMAVCQLICRHLNLNAELARKSVHMGMGVICAAFPLIFTNMWPVFLLCAVAIAGLMGVRLIPRLRHSIGASLHGVKRFSLGELYFPLAVAVVWFISFHKPVVYCISVLVLALADAVAALIGTQFGKNHYTTKDGYKSWEGSIAFFIIAFCCIYIPLQLFTDIGGIECLMIAVLVSVLVMILEAISWSGLDNLFIPLSVCVFINVYESYSVIQMLERLVLIVVFIGLLLSVRKRSKLDDASLLGASLFLYLAYVIGGWQWSLAPLTMFLVYLCLGPWKIKKEEKIHNIHSLLSVIAPGLIWLILFYRYKDEILLIYYNCTFAVELCLIFIVQWAWQYPDRRIASLFLQGNILAIILIILPFMFFNSHFSLTITVVSSFVTVLGSMIFIITQKDIRNCPLTSSRWIRQGVIGFCASLTAMLINQLF